MVERLLIKNECQLLVYHPEYLGVTADDHHAGYQESHDEEKCLRSATVTVFDDGAGLQIRIIVEFT